MVPRLAYHVTITIFPETRSRTESQRKLIKVRDKRQSKVASLGRYLINIPWEDLLSSDQTVDEKLELFTELIHYGLDTIMPERSLKACVNDRPWMTSQLKRLIIQRQKAFTSDNKCLFKFLRNKVNRDRKRCRKLYYRKKLAP